MTLSLQRLAEIRERAEKATPGEWTLSPADCEVRAPSGVSGLSAYPVVMMPVYGPFGGEDTRLANADFAAHAHQDIPALLDEVQALHQVLEDIKRNLTTHGRTSNQEALELIDAALSLRAKTRTP